MNSLETLTTSRTLNTCKKCEWQWFSHKGKTPRACPNCKSSLWNREAKRHYPELGHRGENSLHIIAIRKGNPCATLQQIADKVGVSREFARQVLLRDRLPTWHYFKRQLYECLTCGTPTSSKQFCSRVCQYQYTHPQVECDQCHRLFRREQSQLIYHSKTQAHYFCTKTCQGKWLGKNYGFAVYPEHATGKQKHPRNPQQRIRARWLKHLNFMDREIIGMLHCSTSTISGSLQ